MQSRGFLGCCGLNCEVGLPFTLAFTLGKMYTSFMILLFKEQGKEGEISFREVFEVVEEVLALYGLDFDRSKAFY